MKLAVFSAHAFEVPFLKEANRVPGHELVFLDVCLSLETAALARDCAGVSCFVTDDLSAPVLKILAAQGTKFIALRSAGFNHIDLAAAALEKLTVVRVPKYSPYAVAEFAVSLILSLNRKIHEAHQRVQKHNFSLDGLLGFDLHGKVVGVVGVGAIGQVLAKIMLGFGCRVLAYDVVHDPDCIKMGVEYCVLDELYRDADIISLHCPLTAETEYLIDQDAFSKMKPGVMLINTARGGLLDTKAAIAALRSGTLGYLGMDVYEKEVGLFFRDCSTVPLHDPDFLELQTFPNVLITGHQAFLTREALSRIAATTLQSASDFAAGKPIQESVNVLIKLV